MVPFEKWVGFLQNLAYYFLLAFIPIGKKKPVR
jgi:hypothetical protein